jgi:hypothetical protein
MQTAIKQERFTPVAFKLLGNIRRKLNPLAVNEHYSNSQLVDEIIKQIRTISDELGTPIFRVDQKFIIYEGNKEFDILKSSMHEYLRWCAKDFGISETLAYERAFGDMLFGCAYRVLAPEQSKFIYGNTLC